MDIKGKAVLISGADTAMGRVTAIRMAQAGGRIALIGRDAASLGNLTQTIQGFGQPAICLTGFRERPEDAEEAVAATLEAFGRVDIAVNAMTAPKAALLEDLTEADWEDLVDDVVKGAFNVIKFASKPMVAQKRGSIVNVTARELLGREAYTHFSAAAAALVSLTRTCAVEMGKFQINVNAVAPGEIAWSERSEETSTWAKTTPLRRLGTPREVADAILFLASDAASFITGQTLFVSGGQELLPALVLEPSAIQAPREDQQA